MSTKTIKNYNLTDLLKPYVNKWVALSPDHKEVVSSGDTLEETAAKIKEKDVVFMKVFPLDALYAPTSL